MLGAFLALGGDPWKVASLAEEGAQGFSSVGPSSGETICVAMDDDARRIAEAHNMTPELLLAVRRGLQWQELTLHLLAMICEEKGPNAHYCNICGRVNSHLSNCLLLPFLTAIRDLTSEETPT